MRTWGFDNIFYYPWMVAFLAIACIPSINKWIYVILKCDLKINIWWAGIISTFFFAMGRVKYNFLGDMDLRVEQFVKQEYVGTETLTMWIYYR
jgi:hypothetical protein